jgi:hypothetical protein
VLWSRCRERKWKEKFPHLRGHKNAQTLAKWDSHPDCRDIEVGGSVAESRDATSARLPEHLSKLGSSCKAAVRLKAGVKSKAPHEAETPFVQGCGVPQREPANLGFKFELTLAVLTRSTKSTARVTLPYPGPPGSPGSPGQKNYENAPSPTPILNQLDLRTVCSTVCSTVFSANHCLDLTMQTGKE